MPDDPHKPRPYTTEEQAQKPSTGHSTSEPGGSEGSSRTSKTRTDPQTGEPTPGRPDTAG